MPTFTTQKTFALTLEILTGCQYSCQGCTINKVDAKPPSKKNYEALGFFLDDLEKNDYRLVELELGATDLHTASNRDSLLANKRFQSLVNRFDLFTFNTYLIRPLEKEYQYLARSINQLKFKGKIQIITPFELAHTKNKKYLDTIYTNLNLLHGYLDGEVEEVNLAVNFTSDLFMRKAIGSLPIEDLFETIHALDLNVKTKVNIVLPHGRQVGIDALTKADFIDSIQCMNRLYLEQIEKKEKNKDKLPYQLNIGHEGDELLYYRGHLYLRPKINERFTLLNQHTKFNRKWTYENFYLFKNELLEKNLNLTDNLKDCKDCLFSLHCANKGIPLIMDWLKKDDCFMLFKDHPDKIQLF